VTDKPRNWVEQLSKTMKLLREIKGMGQREHARHLGLKISTLNRIEAGKPCNVDTLVYIHEKTGITYDTLLGSSSQNSGDAK
jgi:transcriptional regulator with XRE-family HTH domain